MEVLKVTIVVVYHIALPV